MAAGLAAPPTGLLFVIGDEYRCGRHNALVPDLARYWDQQAAGFDEAPDHGLRDPVARSAWAELLGAHLPSAPARVVDLGCGTGTLAVLLASAGRCVCGLDFSHRMLDRAVAKAASAGVVVEFAAGDAMSPPWPSESFDCVLSRHVLWAMPDPAVALDRWLALLRPSGRLVLIEGRWSTGAGLSAEQLLSLLRDSGRLTTVIELTNPDLWGGPINDERYLLVSEPASPADR